MTGAQPLAESQESPHNPDGDPNNAEPFKHGDSLRDAVTIAMQHYLKDLDGQMATDVYTMVLAEIEAPLLTQVMEYTRNNQTKASIMLGLNRGTLRKKLKQYNLIAGEQD